MHDYQQEADVKRKGTDVERKGTDCARPQSSGSTRRTEQQSASWFVGAAREGTRRRGQQQPACARLNAHTTILLHRRSQTPGRASVSSWFVEADREGTLRRGQQQPACASSARLNAHTTILLHRRSHPVERCIGEAEAPVPSQRPFRTFQTSRKPTLNAREPTVPAHNHPGRRA
ncbi:hypothetical protein quinque_007523 [Culex quinquefasciatus]